MVNTGYIIWNVESLNFIPKTNIPLYVNLMI